MTIKESQLNEIFSLLQEKTGINFAEYKEATIDRRVKRRLALNRINNIKSYINLLQNNSKEVELLEKDLLICVTHFFRYPSKFAVLKKTIFPNLIKERKTTNEPIRIWVPGCATGEEAYSIAISLIEFLGKHSLHIPIQLFATDIVPSAIEKARKGIYSEDIEEYVTPERLRHFFNKTETGYQIKETVREMCIFAVHNLAQNPPFSNLDFISCLNVLIYLKPELQARVVNLFHSALNSGGILMLGSSENIGSQKNLFSPIDVKQKIYTKNSISSTTQMKKVLKKLQQKNTVFPIVKKIKNQMNNGEWNIAEKNTREEKIKKLRESLVLTREYADAIMDELDNMTRELEAANEELLVNNEELQTANEELETSQEELEAANEELITLNEEIQKREEEKSRLAAIVESSDDAIISKDKNGIITSWNKGAKKLYGYTEKEIIGKSIQVLMPPYKKNDFPKIMKLLYTGKKIEHYETQRMTKDGKILDVSLTISPLKDSYGKIIGASKIARDITERKRAEKNITFLSEASKILSSSLDYKTTLHTVAKLAVPEIADWCTVDMLNTFGTLDAVAIAHKDPQKVAWARELRKTNPTDMNAPQGIAHVIKTGEGELYPLITDDMLVATAKNKKQLQLMRDVGFTSAIIVPITIEKKIIGAITFVTTETRRQYTQSDFAMAKELASRASLAIQNAKLYTEAKKAIDLRDDFISIASHELKTPITSLKAYTQVLQRHAQKSQERTTNNFLQKMDQQINNLTKLVRDLLDISKLENGKLEFQIEKFDLNELIKETIENVQHTTQKQTIIFEGKINQPVTGDRFRIYQVLVNLLTNAIKYSAEAEKIIVRVKQEKNAAVVEVQDFGIGIDKEYQKNIFKRFYRIDNHLGRAFPGLGIGLYISHEIIQRHGGNIYLDSKRGKGAIFSFTLPFHVTSRPK
jgi:PAS domain S-box-containing protein